MSIDTIITVLLRAAGDTADYDLVRELAALALGGLNPSQPMGSDLFEAAARVTITFAVETVMLRYGPDDGTIEVYLTRRGAGEAYAGLWHSPGSAMRPGEELADVVARLGQREFGVPIVALLEEDDPVYWCNNIGEERGHFATIVVPVEAENRAAPKPPTSEGGWFSVDNLPPDIVDQHYEVIRKAVKSFKETRIA